jgi:hypothetical protein
MLNIQTYLQSGKTAEDLEKELGISCVKHPTLPLAIYNYSMIDSPKSHPVVREARGLVLDTNDHSLVAKAFNRFFNVGEMEEEMKSFHWGKAFASGKEDGSLCLIYNYQGKWHANTRGSFGLFPMFNYEWQAKYYGLDPSFTWQEGFLKAMGIQDLQDLRLDPSLTYVCEFTSLWNKVVREYKEPAMHLLTRFQGEQEITALLGELEEDEGKYFKKVQKYSFRGLQDAQEFVLVHPEATYEGVVIYDYVTRWKLKNPRYVSLHRAKGNNGEALYKPSTLLPYILSGEGDEFLSYFKEVKAVYNEMNERVQNAYLQLEDIWSKTWQIEDQKEFALSIVKKTPFTGILFNFRRGQGKNQTVDGLKKIWRGYADGIEKVLFSKK